MFKLHDYDSVKDREDMRFGAIKIDYGIYDWMVNPTQGFFRGGGTSPFVAAPVILLDLPFSLVTDIIMLPGDWANYFKYDIAGQKREAKTKKDACDFWEQVFRTGNIEHDKARQYLQYLNNLDNGWFTQSKFPDIFDVIWDLSITNNSYAHFQKLATMPRLSEEQYWRLYNSPSVLTKSRIIELKWQSNKTYDSHDYSFSNNVNISAVRAALAVNPSVPDVLVLEIAAHEKFNFSTEAPRKMPFILIESRFPDLSQAPDVVRYFAACSPDAPPEVLAMLAENTQWYILFAVAQHPNTPSTQLAKLAEYEFPGYTQRPPNDLRNRIHRRLAANPSTPPATLDALAQSPISNVRSDVCDNPSTSIETLQKLIDGENEWLRNRARNKLESRNK